MLAECVRKDEARFVLSRSLGFSDHVETGRPNNMADTATSVSGSPDPKQPAFSEHLLCATHLAKSFSTLYLETSPNSPIIVHVLLTRALPNITPKTAESSQRQAGLAPKSLL